MHTRSLALTLCLLLGLGCRTPAATITAPTVRASKGYSARAVELYLRGRLMILDARYPEAEAALKEALIIDPGSPTILRALAEAAEGSGEIGRRDEYLRRADALGEARGAP